MSLYVWFVRGNEHAALCATSMECVRTMDPEASLLVMTDDQAMRLPDEAPVHCVRRFPSGMPIMLANLEAQVRAFTHAKPFEQVTFLDTDVLLTLPITHSMLYDLTVTWRDTIGNDEDGKPIEGIAKMMPYNYGVLSASNQMPAVEAFIFMRERIRVMARRMQDWYGNQMALAQLCGPRPKTREPVVEERSIPWLPTQQGNPVRIQKLAAERWNYTPQAAGEAIANERFALHFKGGKRHLMKSYADTLGLRWYL